MAVQALSNPVWVKNTALGRRYELGSLTIPFGLIANQAEGITDTYIKETAGQTYKKGDLVYGDTNGTIAICTVSGNQQNSAILGQAMVDATGVTGAQTRVAAILPADIFMMNLFHTTPASAVGTDATVWSIFGIFKSAAGRWHVDLVNTVEGAAATALGRVRVVGYPTRGFDGAANAITDQYAVVFVQFLPFSLDLTDSVPFVRILQFQGS